MRISLHSAGQRQGAIAPMTALFIIPLVGMLAFSIDIGHMCVVESDLQNAADAGALAGAQKLQNLYVQYNMPNLTPPQQNQIMATATTNTGSWDSPVYTAKQFTKYNKAGGVYINLPDSDVQVGYMDANGNYSTNLNFNFPNTVSVTTRRQGATGSATNGSLPLFFGSVFGVSARDMQATARATIYAGDITSLKPIPGIDSHILPVTLDVNEWQNFYQTGKSPDGHKYYASNGLPQIQVYPDPGQAPGQFSLLDIGPPLNNAPAFRTWIDDGETPNDIQYLLDHNMLPVSPSSPKQWKGGPGLKSTLLTDFQAQIGKPNLLPLFQPISQNPYQAAGGQGSNSYYNIIGFVGVTITEATGNGNNMNISVQPMGTVDATTLILNPQPVGTQQSNVGTTLTTFISAKLTR